MTSGVLLLFSLSYVYGRSIAARRGKERLQIVRGLPSCMQDDQYQLCVYAIFLSPGPLAAQTVREPISRRNSFSPCARPIFNLKRRNELFSAPFQRIYPPPGRVSRCWLRPTLSITIHHDPTEHTTLTAIRDASLLRITSNSVVSRVYMYLAHVIYIRVCVCVYICTRVDHSVFSSGSKVKAYQPPIPLPCGPLHAKARSKCLNTFFSTSSVLLSRFSIFSSFAFAADRFVNSKFGDIPLFVTSMVIPTYLLRIFFLSLQRNGRSGASLRAKEKKKKVPTWLVLYKALSRQRPNIADPIRSQTLGAIGEECTSNIRHDDSTRTRPIRPELVISGPSCISTICIPIETFPRAHVDIRRDGRTKGKRSCIRQTFGSIRRRERYRACVPSCIEACAHRLRVFTTSISLFEMSREEKRSANGGREGTGIVHSTLLLLWHNLLSPLLARATKSNPRRRERGNESDDVKCYASK